MPHKYAETYIKSALTFILSDHGEDDGGMTLLQKLAAQSGAEMRDVDPDTGALKKRRPRGSALKQAKTQKNMEGILQ